MRLFMVSEGVHINLEQVVEFETRPKGKAVETVITMSNGKQYSVPRSIAYILENSDKK